MDETYIKMCDCPEIQGQKPQWLDGEFVALRGVDTKAEQAGEVLLHSDDRFVWCPMQHQLTEMEGGYKASVLTNLVAFATGTGYIEWWPEPSPWDNFTSWEQLLLAFYMHEKHHKHWNDEEAWIEEQR